MGASISGNGRHSTRQGGRLKTRWVFVDTSVFVAQNFAFSGKRFTCLKTKDLGWLDPLAPHPAVEELTDDSFPFVQGHGRFRRLELFRSVPRPKTDSSVAIGGSS